MENFTNEQPRDGQPIMNRNQFIRKVRRGSHIAMKVCRLYDTVRYYHHFIVERVETETVHVIHYARVPGQMFCSVQRGIYRFDHDLSETAFQQGVYLIWTIGYPTSDQDKEAAIHRALSRINESKYMLSINNCEHFVTWALKESPLSHQIKDATFGKKCGADAFDAVANKSTLISEGTEFVANGTADVIQATGNQTFNPAVNADNIGTAENATTTTMKTTAAITSVVHIVVLAKDIYDLIKIHRTGGISKRKIKRGILTKTSGAIGSVAGAVVGQVLIPVPVVGAALGRKLFGLAGKVAFSAVSGSLFDQLSEEE